MSLLPKRQDFSRRCVYCPNEARAVITRENSILCTKDAKWAFLDRVWSLQYESKASKHEPKANAFCEPKTSTATTRGQNAHLALGAHHIFCNTSILFRLFLQITKFTKKSFFLHAARRRSITDHFQLA